VTEGWNPDEPAPAWTDDEAAAQFADHDYGLPPIQAYKPQRAHQPEPDGGDEGKERTSWWPVDLTALFDGTAEALTPTMFARNDGQPIIYPGKAHAFNGAPESGKSWAALVACVQAINAGSNVLYIDFEDTAPTVVSRLLALGADPDAILDQLTYISPVEALQWGGKFHPGNTDFEDALTARQYDLAILDGVTEAMGLHGLDLNSNKDVAEFYKMLPRRIQQTGCATITIDHIPKNREGGTRGGIGGQHKLAGIDVSFLFEVKSPFGIGQHGICQISIEKDRPGQLRQHATGPKRNRLAEFHLISDPDSHALSADLRAVADGTSPNKGFEPTTLMQRVSEFVAECNSNGTYPSQRVIEDGVSGKSDYIREAIAKLVMHGHLAKGGAGRRVTEHTMLAPYVAPDEP